MLIKKRLFLVTELIGLTRDSRDIRSS